MKNIHTVLGPLPVDQMGLTLAHEHICCGDWSMRANFGPRFCPEEELLARAVDQVNRAKAAGVATIVDGTAINLGRDIHLLRQVSRLTGVNLVASSGFYDQDEPWLAGQSEAYLFDLLDGECKYGIAGTDSRPGIMKCAVGSHGLTATREKILRLTARVAVENHLPLFCHHEASTRLGPQILDLLCGEGMDPRRIILGHTGDSEDAGAGGTHPGRAAQTGHRQSPNLLCPVRRAGENGAGHPPPGGAGAPLPSKQTGGGG